MKTSSLTTLIYSLFVFLDGVMGFEALKNLPSLLLEVPLSLILFIAALRMIPHKKYAHHVAALACLPLMIYYGVLFGKEQQYFAGVLTAFSTIVFAINVIAVFQLGEPE